MKTALRWAVPVALVLFAAAQFIRPERTNPPVDPSRTIQARATVPPEVKAIFDRSCIDCHTHQTRWPWYSRVAPASWLVVSDVNEGREELNLSDWQRYSRRDADHLLEEMCKMVQTGRMPLREYLLLHRHAGLSDQEVRTLCDWTIQYPTRLGFGSQEEKHER